MQAEIAGQALLNKRLTGLTITLYPFSLSFFFLLEVQTSRSIADIIQPRGRFAVWHKSSESLVELDSLLSILSCLCCRFVMEGRGKCFELIYFNLVSITCKHSFWSYFCFIGEAILTNALLFWNIFLIWLYWVLKGNLIKMHIIKRKSYYISKILQ